MGSLRWNRSAVKRRSYQGFFGFGTGGRDTGALYGNTGNAGAMPRVPFWAGAAHVMPFGTIGVEGALDQPLAMRHDRIKAAEQRQERARG